MDDSGATNQGVVVEFGSKAGGGEAREEGRVMEIIFEGLEGCRGEKMAIGFGREQARCRRMPWHRGVNGYANTNESRLRCTPWATRPGTRESDLPSDNTQSALGRIKNTAQWILRANSTRALFPVPCMLEAP